MDLYAALLAIEAEIDSHESDLYVRHSPAAAALIKRSGRPATTFIVNGKIWWDIPFAYEPWWKRNGAKV